MTGGFATDADFDELPPLDELRDVDEPMRLPVARDLDELGVDPPDRAPDPREAFAQPEDRGLAVLSALGEVEYVEDLARPGRVVVVAAEEGAGKSYAITGELGIRVAVAGGSFAGTWPVLRTGPVLVLSEMHTDDDYAREEAILAGLELERRALVGRYWRLPLMTAAGGPPALTVPEWRTWAVEWLRDAGALLLIVDTATGASQVDPWGKAIQGVYADLRAMLEAYPELAIILVVHLKKPNGKGDRRISDVLGEWGRWNDVTILLEADGTTRTKISTLKRVRRQRHIVATRSDGLLVDPIDLDEDKGTKVPQEDVVAAVVADPGLGQRALATALNVSASTAAKYAETAEADGLIVRVNLGRGRGFRLYPADSADSPLDTLPSNRPTPSNEHVGHPLDGGLEGPGEGVSSLSTHPIGVDTPSTGHPPSAPVDTDLPAPPLVETEAPSTVHCRDYRAHHSEHRKTAAGWVCDTCEDEGPSWLDNPLAAL